MKRHRIKTIFHSHHFWFHVFTTALRLSIRLHHIWHTTSEDIKTQQQDKTRQGKAYTHPMDTAQYTKGPSSAKHYTSPHTYTHTPAHKTHHCHNLLVRTLRDIISIHLSISNTLWLSLRWTTISSDIVHTAHPPTLPIQIYSFIESNCIRVCVLCCARYVFYSLSSHVLLPASLVNIRSPFCRTTYEQMTSHRTQCVCVCASFFSLLPLLFVYFVLAFRFCLATF